MRARKMMAKRRGRKWQKLSYLQRGYTFSFFVKHGHYPHNSCSVNIQVMSSKCLCTPGYTRRSLCISKKSAELMKSKNEHILRTWLKLKSRYPRSKRKRWIFHLLLFMLRPVHTKKKCCSCN